MKKQLSFVQKAGVGLVIYALVGPAFFWFLARNGAYFSSELLIRMMFSAVAAGTFGSLFIAIG